MSNFVYGRVVVNDVTKLINSKIDFSIVNFCISNNFALHFIDSLPTKNTKGDINFQISDNFFVKYCEYFMEPVVYTLDGKPIIENLINDLNKLQGLIQIIFKFEFVEKIELRFSYVEVDEDDYEICKTCIEEMKSLILEKFLSNTNFPVINIVLNKFHKNNLSLE